MSQLPPLLPPMLPPLQPVAREVKRRGRWYIREYEPGKYHLLCNGTYSKLEMEVMIADLIHVVQPTDR